MSKTSAKVKPLPQTDWLTRHKVAIIIIVAVLLVDIFITGFMKFGYNVVRCGGVPYNVQPAVFEGWSRFYREPLHYIPGGVGSDYYCHLDQIPKNIEKDPPQGS